MTTPQPSEPAPRWEQLAGAFLVLAATIVFAALSWKSFRPPAGVGGDITQDWLSAREYLAGRPAYGDLRDATRAHLGSEHPDGSLRWNAHPPASVLLVLPLALLQHEDAFFVWNCLTFLLFVGAVWIVAAQLGLRGLRAAGVAAVVAVVGVTCFPLRQQVSWSQFSAPLAFLITVAWTADRNGRWRIAGAAVGLAAALKLFPAFLLLYFAASGKWRTVVAALVTGLAVNAVAAAVLGFDAYRAYATDAVPAVAAKYGATWTNLSVAAFWLRLFDPNLPSGVIALADAPIVGRALALAARVAVVAAVGWVAWRSCGTGQRPVSQNDLAFASAVVGMVLVSPISWAHSLVMLVVPVGVLLRATHGVWRWPLFVCLVLLWLPDTFVTGLVFGRELAEALVTPNPRPLMLAENLLGTSVPHYALAGLFLLTLRRPNEPPDSRGAG